MKQVTFRRHGAPHDDWRQQAVRSAEHMPPRFENSPEAFANSPLPRPKRVVVEDQRHRGVIPRANVCQEAGLRDREARRAAHALKGVGQEQHERERSRLEWMTGVLSWRG